MLTVEKSDDKVILNDPYRDIMSMLKRGAQRISSRDVIRPNFSAEKTINKVLSHLPDLCYLSLFNPEVLKYTKGLKNSIIEQGFQDEEGYFINSREMFLDNSIVEEVRKKITQAGNGLKVFEYLRRHSVIDDALNWIGLVNKAELRLQGIDKVYNFIRHASGLCDVRFDPHERFMLMGLTYLPNTARTMIQDPLIYGLYLFELERMKEERSSEELATLNVLEKYIRSGIFIDNHWQQLVHRFGASEHVIKELQTDSFVRVNALLELRSRINIPEANVSLLCGEFLTRTKDIVQEFCEYESEHNTTMWQLTDVGHFLGLVDFLLGSLSSGELEFGRYNDRETYKRVVILEDTQAEMKSLVELINMVDKYKLYPERRSECTKPEEVYQFICDENVELFILDIQNGETKQAGIILAEKILRERTTLIAEGSLPPTTKTNLVVWSKNHEAVKLAKEHLENVLSNLFPEVPQYQRKLQDLGARFDNIEVQVNLKSDSLHFLDYS